MNDQLPLPTAIRSSIAHLFNAAPWPVLIIDDAGTITHVNPPLLSLFGYEAKQLIAQPLEMLLPTQPRNHAMNADLFVRGQCSDGSEKSLSIRLQALDAYQHESTIIFVTELNTVAEQPVEMVRINRTLRLVHDCNQILVRARSETELLSGMVQRFAELGSCPLAWVGYSIETDAAEVDVAASAGKLKDELSRTLSLRRGAGIAGQAIRCGVPLIVRRTPHDGDRAPPESDFSNWSAAAIALPLIANHVVIGCLCVNSNFSDAFGKQEVGLLLELADDMAYGIATLRARTERRRTETRRRILTPRQTEVLRLIASGSSTKEIARMLIVSVKTVETHRAQIMERLDIREVAGLVRYAIRIGLVKADQ